MFLVAESGEFEVITRFANMVAQSWVSSGSVKAEKWRGKTRLNGGGWIRQWKTAPAGGSAEDSPRDMRSRVFALFNNELIVAAEAVGPCGGQSAWGWDKRHAVVTHQSARGISPMASIASACQPYLVVRAYAQAAR